ncbi:MAG: hypothetical protein ACHQ9S_13990 [Candidatus Binatia bacterium]
MMTTTRRGVSGDFMAPDSAFAAERGDADTGEQGIAESWQASPQHGSAATTVPGGGARRKRRRQRSQRGKRQGPPQSRSRHGEGVSREHIFQELEGLLRQIREEAEESLSIAEEQISEVAHTVSTFTKALDEQSDPISERLRSEYQRIREKLVHTLRGER